MPIRITPYEPMDLPPSNWTPIHGLYYKEFIKNLSDDEFDVAAKERITLETSSILGVCHDPHASNESNTTGCVIGYVQSGKTTSFNALTMMALDNSFDLVIVLGGRTNNLFDQNRDEFQRTLKDFIDKDLAIVKAPKISGIKKLPIQRLTDNHKLFQKIPIVSVHLKHQDHISELTKLLRSENEIIQTKNVLIIDDEADNASLNANFNTKHFHASAVYRSILNLRNALPRHSYIQYTATPQALLLNSRDDPLSPQWARFITPGKDYIGTNELFNDDSFSCMKIPENEIIDDFDNLNLTLSFHKALRTYLLTAAQAANRAKDDWGPKNVTMMVHPHRETKYQDAWGKSILALLKDWDYEIRSNQNYYLQENRELFLDNYKSLKVSSNELNLPIDEFEKLYELVPYIIQNLMLSVLNRSRDNINILTKEVDWDDKYNIVIGGDLLDRGYVVKGLVTTYMPRQASTNADTLQQRGRFYGYKRQHFNFLKIWLSQSSINAFKAYLESEEQLYTTLKAWSLSGNDLGKWKREILLSPDLEPCRRSIIGIDLVPNAINKSGWFWPRLPLDFNHNNLVIENLIQKFSSLFFLPDEAINWTPATRYLQANDLDLEEVIDLTFDFNFDPSDQPKWLVVQSLLGTLVSKGYKASISLMGTSSADLNNFENRNRSLSKKIITSEDPLHKNTVIYDFKNPFQGATPATGYPGARKIFYKNKKTVNFQIHKLNIKKGNSSYTSLVLMVKLPPKKGLITELTNTGFEIFDESIFSDSD
jgi:hypothetical protein